jgi:hypothetical protein
MSAGLVKLDSQKRVSLGKYTPLQPGQYLQIERLEDGTLILRPAHLQPVLESIPAAVVPVEAALRSTLQAAGY